MVCKVYVFNYSPVQVFLLPLAKFVVVRLILDFYDLVFLCGFSLRVYL